MQIALVAVVLLAGMWFTVLKPKSADTGSSAPVAQTQTPASQPVAPGVKGLATAVDKAKGAAATSDAANAKIQSATGGNGATASASTATAAPKHTVAKKAAAPATARKPGTKAATAKAVATKPVAAKPAATKTSTATKAKKTAAKPAADVDPSTRLLAYLKQGKTLVVLFYGKGADDKAARKAVHLTAKGDPKNVVSAYVPIAKVGSYEAITRDVDVLAAPTILVISSQGKATPLTGYVDATVVRNAVAAARTAAAATKK